MALSLSPGTQGSTEGYWEQCGAREGRGHWCCAPGHWETLEDTGGHGHTGDTLSLSLSPHGADRSRIPHNASGRRAQAHPPRAAYVPRTPSRAPPEAGAGPSKDRQGADPPLCACASADPRGAGWGTRLPRAVPRLAGQGARAGETFLAPPPRGRVPGGAARYWRGRRLRAGREGRRARPGHV